MKRRLLKGVVYTVGTVVLLLAFVFFYAWRSPAFYTAYEPHSFAVPIMTMAEYDEVVDEHARPYVVEVEAAKGAVLLFGAAHTRDTDDPQLAELRQRWADFRPTVLLVEGRLGFLMPGLMDPVAHYGEMGAANALARRDDVPVYSWEPPRETEIAMLLHDFPAERVALFYVLRPYFSNLRFGKPDDPEAFVEEFRATRTQYPGLEGTLPDVAAIDRIWQRDFAGLPDWRDTTDEYGLPGYLADLAARSNAVRDEHFAHVILDLAARGERVFAVAGSSHAVKLDRTLRATLAE